MCENLTAITSVTEYCRKNGLEWHNTNSGILVNNGIEYFLMKMKKDKVRRLYHQNHNRNNKRQSLNCLPEEFNNDILARDFHVQPWEEKDIKKTMLYIMMHGNKRSKLEKSRQNTLSRLGL